MSYPVYLVSSVGAPRDHHAIFVETDNNGYGFKFQVTGNIQEGMVYELKTGEKPEDSITFITKSYIGTTSEEDFDRIGSVLWAIPPPAKQFNGPRRIDPSLPLRRCQEWTKEAIQALKEQGIL